MYQKVIVVGNLGNDPVMRYTPNGHAVVNFNVATNRSYTTSEGVKVEEVTWFRATAWQKLAEICNQYLKKGNKVLIEGRLNSDDNGNPRVWIRDDGTPAANYEITANEVKFLTPKNGENEALGEAPAVPSGDPEDIPF